MIDEELKAILACPACKGDLLFEETRIICPACRKAYPIRDGIPVMLISDLQKNVYQRTRLDRRFNPQGS